MRDWATRARDAVSPLGRPATHGRGDRRPGAGRAFAGRVPEGRAAPLEAAALVDALPDAEFALRLDAAANLAAAELYLDRFRRLRPTPSGHCGSAARRARATSSRALPDPGVGRGCAAGWPSRPTCSTARSRPHGFPGMPRSSHGTCSTARHTALQAGDLEMALAAADESYRAGAQDRQRLVPAYAGIALAGALLGGGEARRAVEVLAARPAGRSCCSSRAAGGQVPRTADALLARARLPRRGRAGGRCAEARAAAVPLLMPRAMAGRARAAVLLADDPTAAAQRALASASDAASVGAADRVRALAGARGPRVRPGGRARRAVAELERAAAELHATGQPAIGTKSSASSAARPAVHRRPGRARSTRPESTH